MPSDRRRLLLRCCLAAALAHLVVQLVLFPGHPLLGFPVHSDDFRNLASTSFTWHWPALRPVSQLCLEALSALGVSAFYVALHVLTVLHAGLVLAFLCLLLDSRPGLVALFAGALAASGLETSVDQVRYTGMITNLSASVLGVGSLILLWSAFERGGLRLFAGIGCAALALLAKEDQLLAALLVCACAATLEPDPAFRRRARAALACLVLLGLAFAGYSRWLAPSPFLGQVGPTHALELRPLSVARTVGRFSLLSPGATLATVCFAGALAIGFWRRDRLPLRRLALPLGVVLALMLPYSLLPGRVYGYYVGNWAPWQLGLLPAFAFARGPAGRRSRVAVTAALLAAAGAVLWVSRPGRLFAIAWYDAAAARSRATLALLERLRPELAGAPRVAVTGISFPNPWRATDGAFLANRLGLGQTWIVLARDDYLRGLAGYGVPMDNGRVLMRPARDLPGLGAMPLLILRPDGTGTLRRSAASDGGARPRLELVPAGCDPPHRDSTRLSWWVDSGPVAIRERAPGDRLLGVGTGAGSLLARGLVDGAVIALERDEGRGAGPCLAVAIAGPTGTTCR